MATTPRDIKNIARALIESACDNDVAVEVLRDLRTVARAFALAPEALADLSDQTVLLADRQKAMQKAFHKHVHEFVLNALLALQRRDLLSALEPFIQISMTFGSKLANATEATVTSAIALTATERTHITKSLTEKFKKTIDIHEVVDPGILGGLLIDIEDTRIDASVKGNIDRLKHALTH